MPKVAVIFAMLGAVIAALETTVPAQDFPDFMPDLETAFCLRAIHLQIETMNLQPESLWALTESQQLRFGQITHFNGSDSRNPCSL